MNMMTQPEDNLFQDMLTDYTMPASDDGFTDILMQKIQAEKARAERLRKSLIYGACFIGGVIAATQLPALVTLLGGVDIVVPDVPSPAPLPMSQWAFPIAVLLGFVLWAALDRKASEIF